MDNIFYFKLNGKLYIEMKQAINASSVCSGCCFEERGCAPFNFSKCKASVGYIFKPSPWDYLDEKLKFYNKKNLELFNQRLIDLQLEHRIIKRG